LPELCLDLCRDIVAAALFLIRVDVAPDANIAAASLRGAMKCWLHHVAVAAETADDLLLGETGDLVIWQDLPLKDALGLWVGGVVGIREILVLGKGLLELLAIVEKPGGCQTFIRHVIKAISTRSGERLLNAPCCGKSLILQHLSIPTINNFEICHLAIRIFFRTKQPLTKMAHEQIQIK
jgi:hypothetical protein